MLTSRPAVLLGTLLLALTACSGGDDDAKAAQAISDAIMESQEGQQGAGAQMFTLPREDADCIGAGFVDEIGTERLQEYGFLTEDLESASNFTDVEMSQEDAASAADTLLACADVQQMMGTAMADFDAETRACFEEVLTDEALRSLFTKMFSGRQDEAAQELTAPMMECAAPDLQDQ